MAVRIQGLGKRVAVGLTIVDGYELGGGGFRMNPGGWHE